jgi:hypothetical protein
MRQCADRRGIGGKRAGEMTRGIAATFQIGQDRADDVCRMLARVTARHPIPPERRIGYGQAARQFLN